MEMHPEQPPNRELDKLRDKIDRIDEEIISLVARRFQVTDEVGVYKKDHQMDPEDAPREEKMKKKHHRICEREKLDSEVVDAIFDHILRRVKQWHQEIKES